MAAAPASGASSEQYDGSLAVRDALLQIDMQNRQLDDRGAARWCEWALTEVPAFIRSNGIQRRQSDGFVQAREVNFSNNQLGDRGVHEILRTLYKLKVGVRVLKLYRNHLGRAAASALMDWLASTPIAALELHLSHNYIPREGAVDILKAVAYNGAYPPEKNGRGRVPLWLRLEQNIVMNPEELIAAAEGQMKKIRAASVATSTSSTVPMLCYLRDPAKNECRSDYCIYSRPDGACPLAQVTYLANQRDQRTRVPPESQSWNTSRDQREETHRWRIVPSTGSLGAAMQRPGLMRQSSDLRRSESGDALGDDPATPSAPSREVSASVRAREAPAPRPSQWAAGPPSMATSASPGVLEGGAASPAAGDSAGPPSVKPPPPGLARIPKVPADRSVGPPPMLPPTGPPVHHGLEGVDMPAAPEVKAAPPGFQGEAQVKAAPAGFNQAEFPAVVRRPPPETPVPAKRQPEAKVKGPPPGLQNVAGGAKGPPPHVGPPPQVKPPPPGFESATPAPKQAPLSSEKEAYKAPPPGFVTDVAVKAAPPSSETGTAPAKAPPAKAPPAIVSSASSAGDDVLLSRAMRERAHVPMASVKNPPPSRGQPDPGRPQQASGSPTVLVKGPPPKLAPTKEPPTAKPPPLDFKSPPASLQAAPPGVSGDVSAVPETKAAPSKDPPQSKQILKRPPVGSPRIVAPAPPEMPPPEAPRPQSAAGQGTSPAVADAPLAATSTPAATEAIGGGMAGVSAVVARRVQQGSAPEGPPRGLSKDAPGEEKSGSLPSDPSDQRVLPSSRTSNELDDSECAEAAAADAGHHEAVQDADQEESDIDEVLALSADDLQVPSRNPSAPWRKSPAQAQASATNGLAQAEDQAVSSTSTEGRGEVRAPGNRPWRNAAPGSAAPVNGFGPPARAPPPAPFGAASMPSIWGPLDGADNGTSSADGHLQTLLSGLGTSLVQEVSAETPWGPPPHIGPPPAEPPPPIDTAAEDPASQAIFSKPPGLPSPAGKPVDLLPDAVPEFDMQDVAECNLEAAREEEKADEEAAEQEEVVKVRLENEQHESIIEAEEDKKAKEEEEEIPLEESQTIPEYLVELDELEELEELEKEELPEQVEQEEKEDPTELVLGSAPLNSDAPEFVPKTAAGRFLDELSDEMPPLQEQQSTVERREEEDLQQCATLEQLWENLHLAPEVVSGNLASTGQQLLAAPECPEEERSAGLAVHPPSPDSDEEILIVKPTEAAPPKTSSASEWLNGPTSPKSDGSEDAAFAAAFERDISWAHEQREGEDDANISREEENMTKDNLLSWRASEHPWRVPPSQAGAAPAVEESTVRRESLDGRAAEAVSGVLDLSLDHPPQVLKEEIRLQRLEIQAMRDRLVKQTQELRELRRFASSSIAMV